MPNSSTSAASHGDSGLHLWRRVLTNSRDGTHVDSWGLSHYDLPLATPAGWSIKKYTLHGGKQEGVELIEVDNGRLRLVVIPTRGMSVLRVDCGDVRLGWDSPVKEVVHPQFVHLESRGGLGWLDGFNEWIVRCGLEWTGHPGPDRFRNRAGDEVEMNLTLHGKVGNIPASEVEVTIDAQPPHRIHLRGRVEERMFNGPKLSLWTDISTEPGSDSFRIEDSVTNEDAHEQEFQLIYHTNFGPPLLGEGARFFAPVSRIKPFTAHAAKDVSSYGNYAGPKAGFAEQVYCLHPLAGADDRTLLLLQNAKGDRAASMGFSVKEMPYVTLWKNLAAAEEGYVTGLEPGTGFPYRRQLERAAGRVPKLAPKETRNFSIDVSIYPDRAAVSAARARIEKIQGEVKPTVDAV